MKVVVVIPTYNEAGGIVGVLDEITGALSTIQGHDVHLLIVDANSPDGTGGLVTGYGVEHPNVHLLTETKKEGIGAAYIAGFSHAMKELRTDVLISFDGDGQHNPRDIERLIKKIEEGCDYVVGSRYVPGGAVPREWALYRRILSRYGSMYGRWLLNLPVHDVTTGLRAMRVKGFAERLPLTKEGLVTLQYSYIFQYTYLMHRMGAKICEIPIHFRLRENDTSKSTLKDILESLRVTWELKKQSRDARG